MPVPTPKAPIVAKAELNPMSIIIMADTDTAAEWICNTMPKYGALIESRSSRYHFRLIVYTDMYNRDEVVAYLNEYAD